VTISDRRKAICNNMDSKLGYNAVVITANDYYSFGSVMIGREFVGDTVDKYRFGFNGKEKTDETYGEGNEMDFGARIYDGRLGRWLSTDPLQKKIPGLSPYNFAINRPIVIVDVDGRDVHQSAEFANGKSTKAALPMFTSTSIGKDFLLQFAKINQLPPQKGTLNVDLGTQTDGKLSNHNIRFNTEASNPGETSLKIKNKEGKFVDYKSQIFDENVQFEISIGIYATKFDAASGTAYIMGHETFIHAESIRLVLDKFETSKTEAKGDKQKIAAAISTLREDLKSFDPTNKKEYKKNEAKQHATIITGKGNEKLNTFFRQLCDFLKGDEKQLKEAKSSKGRDERIQNEDTEVKKVINGKK